MHTIFKIILIFSFIELFLRFILYFKKKKFKILAPKINKITKKQAFKPHPFIGYCKKENITDDRFPSNNYGFAGTINISKEKKNKKRIIVCGDSTVEQNDLDKEEPFDKNLTWPKVMENELEKYNKDIEVINAGCPGYTVLDSSLHLIAKGIHFNPDFAILYSNICDPWFFQAAKNFKDDYTHSRKMPNFPKRNNLILKFLPEFRISYTYQFILAIFYKIFYLRGDNLIDYLHKSKKIEFDYSNINNAKKTYKKYLKTFCGICIANNIIPILIPFKFNEDLINKKALLVEGEFDKEKFINLIHENNKSINELQNEIKEVKILNIRDFNNNCYRSDQDWIHFSKKGLFEMGTAVAKEIKDFF